LVKFLGLINGMNREEDPQLWDLLGRAKSATPSPFFARNVVRAVRGQSRNREGLFAWLSLRRVIPALSTVIAVVVTAFTFQVLHHQDQPSQAGLASAEIQDADLVADLDILVSDDDSDDTLLL
jgi:hypothetical protein